ncbi:hypothetical protein, partial [Planktotalea sp.]|uniref:hypothetical protein n=1 Tax=Planktotalea sp. TaxID=2029877 RepID=UPI003F6B2509
CSCPRAITLDSHSESYSARFVQQSHPIGKLDDDPAKLIEFDVTTAKPVTKSGVRHNRAKVIIEFFGLNRRDSLHYQRATFIQLLFLMLEKEEDESIDFLLSDRAPHAACLRSFHQLWKSDHARATEAYEACQAIIMNNFDARSSSMLS